MKNFFKKILMFSWKLLDEFMSAPWRVDESPLMHVKVRQGEWNSVFENEWIDWLDEMFPFPIHESLRFNSSSSSPRPEKWMIYRPFHRRVNRVKGPWSMLYVYAYTRARNNIKVSSENRLQMSWNSPETNPSTNQRVSKKFAESLKKVVANIWQICCKAVILHPLSREKRRWVEILNKGTETWASTSKKTFLKISSEKFW